MVKNQKDMFGSSRRLSGIGLRKASRVQRKWIAHEGWLRSSGSPGQEKHLSIFQFSARLHDPFQQVGQTHRLNVLCERKTILPGMHDELSTWLDILAGKVKTLGHGRNRSFDFNGPRRGCQTRSPNRLRLHPRSGSIPSATRKEEPLSGFP